MLLATLHQVFSKYTQSVRCAKCRQCAGVTDLEPARCLICRESAGLFGGGRKATVKTNNGLHCNIQNRSNRGRRVGLEVPVRVASTKHRSGVALSTSMERQFHGKRPPHSFDPLPNQQTSHPSSGYHGVLLVFSSKKKKVGVAVFAVHFQASTNLQHRLLHQLGSREPLFQPPPPPPKVSGARTPPFSTLLNECYTSFHSHAVVVSSGNTCNCRYRHCFWCSLAP